MAKNSYAPCPECKALNLSHRRSCWKCTRTLPMSFAMDAKRYAALEQKNKAIAAATKAKELEKQAAQTANETSETPEAAPGIAWLPVREAFES